jgi:undecaprenyl diphosphate synthase
MDSVRAVVKVCLSEGIECLTLFAFSSENWRRPAEEVGLLMNLFMVALDHEVKKLHKHGVRLRIVGDVSAFAPELQQRIVAAEQLTTGNTALTLIIAANYGGRWDITQAARSIAAEVARGELDAAAVTQEMIESRLSLSGLPEPDLFIRTGGEQRISNFLLWQLAYTELYFTPLLWPEFDDKAFADALQSFAGRQRRFGRTGEQVEQMLDA